MKPFFETSWRIPAIPQTFLERLLVFGLVSVHGICAATSSMGRAAVADASGRPCFYVADSESGEDSPMVRSISVSDITAEPARTIWWTMLRPDEPLRHIDRANCLLYGEPLGAGSTTKGSAPVLEPGRRYSVHIGHRSRSPGDSSRGFVASFCVTRDEAGKKRVHELPWDAVAEQWDDSTCSGKAVEHQLPSTGRR